MVIDLASISCVVGHIQVGRNHRWGIIDRSEEIVGPWSEKDPELIEEMLEDYD